MISIERLLIHHTFGLRSISTTAFNQNHLKELHMPQSARNQNITVLKVYNLSLILLGYLRLKPFRYLPGVATMSGIARILIASFSIYSTLQLRDSNAKNHAIIGDWYTETLVTEIAQIARGAIEAFVPFGQGVNLFLDVTFTFINIYDERRHSMDSNCQECINGQHRFPAHPNPKYFGPCQVLYLV